MNRQESVNAVLESGTGMMMDVSGLSTQDSARSDTAGGTVAANFSWAILFGVFWGSAAAWPGSSTSIHQSYQRSCQAFAKHLPRPGTIGRLSSLTPP